MAERVEIEITSGGEGKSDEQLQREEEALRDKRRRRAQADSRAEARERRSQQASERAAAKEKDRVEDRGERDNLRQKRTETAAAKAREKAAKRRAALEAQEEAHQNAAARRAVTLRRRFINDMLGAFNQAHMGRRINHAIDFIQAIFNRRPIVMTAAGIGMGEAATATAAATGGAAGGSEAVRTAATAAAAAIGTQIRGLGATIGNTLKTALTGILGRLARGVEMLTGWLASQPIRKAAGKAADYVNNMYRQYKANRESPIVDPSEVETVRGAPGRILDYLRIGGPRGSTVPNRTPDIVEGQFTRRAVRRIAGPVARGAAANVAGTGLIRAGTSLVAGAAGGGGGAAAGGALVAGGAAGGGAIAAAGAALASNPIGWVLAAIGVAVGTLVAGFALANHAVNKFAETLDSIPSALMFAQLEHDLIIFQKQLRRGQEFGKVLADIQREKTKRSVIGMDLKDSLMTGFLPYWLELQKTVTNILESMRPGLNAIIMILQAVWKIGEKIFWVINKGFALRDAIDEKIISFIEWLWPELGAFIRWFMGKDKDKPDMDILKELYEFMNNPIAAGNQKKNKFAFNAGI